MTVSETDVVRDIRSDYKYGFSNPDEAEDYFFKSGRGSRTRSSKRSRSSRTSPSGCASSATRRSTTSDARPMPNWGGDLTGHRLRQHLLLHQADREAGQAWDEVPEDIKNTFERLGIPEAERKFLAGVGAQYESEVIYHSLREDLEKQGVIFLDMDSALREHPELVKQVLRHDHPAERQQVRRAELGRLVGRLVHLRAEGRQDRDSAPGLLPHQRREHGPVRADADHRRRGRLRPLRRGLHGARPTRPTRLHSAVVEIIVKKGARCRYTTIQNWSKNVYNLVTKRAVAYEDATMEWVDGNLGSKLTMKYPAVWLMGEGARGEMLSVAFAGDGQHQDAGGKVVHVAPNTSSQIISKSISKGSGRSSYRGLLKVAQGRATARSRTSSATRCSSTRRAAPTPTRTSRSRKSDVEIGHEATVSKVGEEQLFYLMSRGLTEAEAMRMIVNGFIEPIVKELPLEYAVEMNRLIQLQMEGSVG